MAGQSSQETRILIFGGGFGGIRTALDLSRKKIPGATITLISDRHHFEFTPALYRIAAGRNPMETCIPLTEIFKNTSVNVIVDTITGGDIKEKVILGASGARYKYDYGVLALGSEISYFNIPGIEEHSYNIKTVSNALKLKRHLHSLFDAHDGLSKGAMMAQFQFVIVGGGPAGVELAGELREYVRGLAKNHDVSEKLVTVDIIQGGPRLLPAMSEVVSNRILKRLGKLGINVILNRPVVSQDGAGIKLGDIELNARTIIWTAGVKPSSVYKSITGLPLDKNGRIFVGQDMRIVGSDSTFTIGDSASTKYAGTAQTAIYDGHFTAHTIAALANGNTLPTYDPRKVPYVVPGGPGWAVFTYYGVTLSGRLFWWLRQLLDIRFFASILPWRKALSIWREGEAICESCPTCQKDTQ